MGTLSTMSKLGNVLKYVNMFSELKLSRNNEACQMFFIRK